MERRVERSVRFVVVVVLGLGFMLGAGGCVEGVVDVSKVVIEWVSLGVVVRLSSSSEASPPNAAGRFERVDLFCRLGPFF